VGACPLQLACRKTPHNENCFIDRVAICMELRNHLREVHWLSLVAGHLPTPWARGDRFDRVYPKRVDTGFREWALSKLSDETCALRNNQSAGLSAAAKPAERTQST
jgi:hypothetical protein